MSLGTVSQEAASFLRARAPRWLAFALAPVVFLLPLAAPSLMIPVAGALLLVFLAVVADRHPVVATAVGLVALVALPVYSGRYIGGSAIGVTPTLVLVLALAPAALRRIRDVQIVPMDVAVLSFCGLRVASYLLNFSTGPGAAAGVVLYVAIPYVVFRLISLAPEIPRVAAVVVVAAGAAAGLFAIFERRGTANLFFDLPRSGYQAVQFARPEMRLGSVRAEVSFGHPIALGMFLALALVLAVALAFQTRRVDARLALVAASGLMLQGLVNTQSRGPLLVLAVGLALWFLLEVRRLDIIRVASLAVVAVALVSVGPVTSTVSQLTQQSKGDTNESRSADYRLEILDVMKDPTQFSVLGRETAVNEGGVTAVVSTRTGLKSFDNAFALVYLANGLLSLLAFAAVAVLAFTVLGLAGLDAIQRAWVAGLSAASLNLITVNLLTQYEDFYWFAAALAASAWQRVREGRDRIPSPSRDFA